MKTPTCVACNKEMARGFIPEAVPGGVFVSVWHPGDPTKTKATFLERLASPGGVRYAHNEVLAIEAYRCQGCGRVELFALEAPTEGHSM